MNNDITPQKRPLVPAGSPPQAAKPVETIGTRPVLGVSPLVTPRLQIAKPRKSRKKLVWGILGGVGLLLVAIATGFFVWYKTSLLPVSSQDTSRQRVKIVTGSSPGQIADLLEKKKLIRSAFAFDIYIRLSQTRSGLRAGTYSLSASQSTEAIVDHLASGKVDQFNITFLPGATLAQSRTQLVRAGFSETEVDAALSKSYDHPLFKGKPADTDLEGYIYGETYNFDSNATVEQVLAKTFDEYYAAIKNNHLAEGFAKQNLTLYQGITLASIVQREVSSAADRKQVAQIFLKRLGIGMPLGSDVTYQYAAKKLGVSPSPNLDSPYNTRKYAGLPPGPIAAPGLSALQAVANPASGDYLYFLSGDDNITYYATTNEAHEINVRDHCKIKCAVL